MEAAQLLGTVVFALSGVLAVAERRLDWFGAIVVGVVTAVGGGTMRGLILGITPVFWIREDQYLCAAVAGAALAIPLARALAAARPPDRGDGAAGRRPRARAVRDRRRRHRPRGGLHATVAVVSGVLSGAGGGVLRDVLAGRTPLIMRGDIYATAAIAGASVFVALAELTSLPDAISGVLGGLVVVGLRVAAIRKRWRLPELGH